VARAGSGIGTTILTETGLIHAGATENSKVTDAPESCEENGVEYGLLSGADIDECLESELSSAECSDKTLCVIDKKPGVFDVVFSRIS